MDKKRSEKRLFYQEGCYDTPSSVRATKPCLAGWQKANKSLMPSYTGPYDIFTCSNGNENIKSSMIIMFAYVILFCEDFFSIKYPLSVLIQ